MFNSFLQTSLIAHGIKKKIINIWLFDLRSVALDKHRSVDGRPYGGGPGMVLRVDVMDKALKKVLKRSLIHRSKTKIILLTPQGETFKQSVSRELSTVNRMIIVCGHYEGVDERIRDLVDEEISIGDYVLTGGELPAMVVIDAVARNIKGFLGKESSLSEESFSSNYQLPTTNYQLLLEYPQYTRPENYQGKRVPKILLSGDHQKIDAWRFGQSLRKTKKRRPDLVN